MLVAFSCGSRLQIDFKSNLIRPSKDDPIRELISQKHPRPVCFNPSTDMRSTEFAMKLIHVRDGSKAVLPAPKCDFRFTPVSGPRPAAPACPKSANTGSELPTRSPYRQSRGAQ